MNWKLRALAGVTLAVLSPASCSFSGRSHYETIKNPTVADMEAYDARMGIKPKPPASATATPTNPGAGAYVPDSTPKAPATITAPASVPLESLSPTTSSTPITPATPPAIPPLLR